MYIKTYILDITVVLYGHNQQFHSAWCEITLFFTVDPPLQATALQLIPPAFTGTIILTSGSRLTVSYYFTFQIHLLEETCGWLASRRLIIGPCTAEAVVQAFAVSFHEFERITGSCSLFVSEVVSFWRTIEREPFLDMSWMASWFSWIPWS